MEEIEEHEAFLEGHAKLGNRWKQISVEFVPTRDAKQIGSHALNFLTTRGEWQQVGSRRSEGGGMQQGHQSDTSEVSPQRRSKRESSGKHPRHSLIGNNVVISTAPMDVDDGDEEEGESVGSVGSNFAGVGG